MTRGFLFLYLIWLVSWGQDVQKQHWRPQAVLLIHNKKEGQKREKRTQDAKHWGEVSLNVHSSPVRWAFAQCGVHVWVHEPILPPGSRAALAPHRPQGEAFRARASRILHTYGAETDLPNKLSSNNQIIHVSGSNNGGTRAETSGTFPSATPLCVLGAPVDKG